MKTELINVTPAMAREWLKVNTNNRALRPQHVLNLFTAFMRDEYRTTHQGIAFDEEGMNLDGQHRLTAIARCPDGMVFPMYVTRGLSRQRAFVAIDTGIAPRNVADVLREGRGVATTATFLARMHNGNSGITPSYVEPFVRWIERPHEKLLAVCNSVRRTWSAAPVRAAAVVAMMQPGVDKDFVLLTYRALCLDDFDAMSKAAKALYRARVNGRIRAADGNDMFCRALKVFDSKNAALSKVQITDEAGLLAEVRTMIDEQVFGKARAPRARLVVRVQAKPGQETRPSDSI